MLYIIRHGQTEWNLKFIPQGKKNSPLTEKGIKQAKDMAKLLMHINKNLNEYKFIVSPLGRTKECADIIREELGLNIDFIYEPLLEEMSFGLFEGVPNDLHEEKFAKELILKEQDPWNFVYPQGESNAMLENRLCLFLDKYKDIENKILITHNGVSMVLRGILEGKKNFDVMKPEYRHHQNEIYCWNGEKFDVFKDE